MQSLVKAIVMWLHCVSASTIAACQHCKLPFNRADPNMARKHHCRHCGRCVCFVCSQTRIVIPKFGSGQEERVCLLCERVLGAKPTPGDEPPAPPPPPQTNPFL